MFFKIYCKWHTMCLDIRLFFRLLRKKFKRIFSKEEIAIFVHSTGNDNNSGFNSEKPKLTIASALATANDLSSSKKNPTRIVLIADSKGRESITCDKKKRVKL